MYKTRGKPDDVLNKVAAQQEKDLAAAIHINQIKKDVVPKLQLDDFTYLKNPDRGVIAQKGSISSNKKKPAMGQLQKPVTTKTVSIPYKPRWESSKKVPARDEKHSLERELEEVSLELNIGNVQLDQIKKLLDERLKVKDSPGDVKSFLYGVKEDVEYKPRKNNAEVLGKKRFLLTLNNVQQRMQKMQSKFFNGNGLRYKSVKSFYNKKDVEVTDRDKIDEEVVYNKNEKEIMDSAKKALARRKSLLDAEVKSDGVGKKSALHDSIMKSSYLKKEFQDQACDLDVKVNTVITDDNLFGKLEQSFINRPFGKAKPVKPYWPIFNSLKDSLYETD